MLAGGPVIFMCCDHGALDEKEFANAQDALDLLHEGCLCFVMPKEETDAADKDH